MKYLKATLLVGLIGAGAFVAGRLRGIFKNGGSVITYFPGRSFYIFGVYPFDDTYRDELEDLAHNMDDIIDTYMEEITHEEMIRMMTGPDPSPTSASDIDRYFDLS